MLILKQLNTEILQSKQNLGTLYSPTRKQVTIVIRENHKLTSAIKLAPNANRHTIKWNKLAKLKPEAF